MALSDADESRIRAELDRELTDTVPPLRASTGFESPIHSRTRRRHLEQPRDIHSTPG